MKRCHFFAQSPKKVYRTRQWENECNVQFSSFRSKKDKTSTANMTSMWSRHTNKYIIEWVLHNNTRCDVVWMKHKVNIAGLVREWVQTLLHALSGQPSPNQRDVSLQLYTNVNLKLTQHEATWGNIKWKHVHILQFQQNRQNENNSAMENVLLVSKSAEQKLRGINSKTRFLHYWIKRI